MATDEDSDMRGRSPELRADHSTNELLEAPRPQYRASFRAEDADGAERAAVVAVRWRAMPYRLLCHEPRPVWLAVSKFNGGAEILVRLR